jgi:membrane protease YdiL (CAAX protease family)
MEQVDLLIEPGKSTWQNRLQALFEVFLLSGIVSAFLALALFSLRQQTIRQLYKSAPLLTGFLLLESLFALGFLRLILKSHHETLQDLWLEWSEWKVNIFVGIAMVPVLFAVNELIAYFFLLYLPKYVSGPNPLLEIVHTPMDLALFLISAIIAGGIKEELQRAFILNRFRNHLGGAKVGMVLWSIVFGAGHYMQGFQAVVTAGLFGFIFGIVYLVRRNLIAAIVAHGLYDISVLLGYWFFKGSGQ